MLSVAGALGAALLPAELRPYLGLFPLVLGLRAARLAWRNRHDRDTDEPVRPPVVLVGIGLVILVEGGAFGRWRLVRVALPGPG